MSFFAPVLSLLVCKVPAKFDFYTLSKTTCGMWLIHNWRGTGIELYRYRLKGNDLDLKACNSLSHILFFACAGELTEEELEAYLNNKRFYCFDFLSMMVNGAFGYNPYYDSVAYAFNHGYELKWGYCYTSSFLSLLPHSFLSRLYSSLNVGDEVTRMVSIMGACDAVQSYTSIINSPFQYPSTWADLDDIITTTMYTVASALGSSERAKPRKYSPVIHFSSDPQYQGTPRDYFQITSPNGEFSIY